MTTKVQKTIVVDKDTYEEAKKILKEMGIPISTAINIFLYSIKKQKNLPANFKVPNRLTKKVIQEAIEGKNMIKVKNLGELEKLLKKEAEVV